MPDSSFKKLKFVIPLAIILIFSFFIIKFREEFHLLSNISALQFFQLFVLVLLTTAINGSKLNKIIRSFGTHLTGREWFGLSSIATTLNCIIFKSGAVVTAKFLKKKHDFAYTHFIGALGADHVLGVFLNSAIGVLLSCHLTLFVDDVFAPLIIIFLLPSVALLILIRGRFGFKEKQNAFLESIRHALVSFESTLKNKKLLFSLCAHHVTLFISIGLRFYMAASVIGMNIPLLYCYLFTTTMAFIRVFPFIQTDIGSRELAVGFLADIAGIGFKEGMMITVVDRIFEVFWPIVFSAVFKNSIIPTAPKEELT